MTAPNSQQVFVAGVIDRLGEITQQGLAALGIDPTLAAVLLLAVVGAGGYAGGQVIKQHRRPGRRLRRLFRDIDTVVILLHDNPDPDAMGSALGVQLLAARTGVDVTIQYSGQIRHHENRAFRAVLDLDLDRIDTKADLAAENVLLVDHNEPRGFDGADDVTPLAVIDHHPGDGTGERFTDVRPGYGACASIVAEYLDAIGYDPVPSSDPTAAPEGIPPAVATGILYGIQADTDHLTNGCTAAEFDACEFLYPGVDETLLRRIANPKVDAEMLDVKARAITQRMVRPPYCVADVGTVSNVDAIAQAAEELIGLEGITAVVVFGTHKGITHLSGRSHDDRVHMGNVLAAVAEGIPNSGAGGHARMGGGQIDQSHLDDGFIELLFDTMAGER